MCGPFVYQMRLRFDGNSKTTHANDKGRLSLKEKVPLQPLQPPEKGRRCLDNDGTFTLYHYREENTTKRPWEEAGWISAAQVDDMMREP